ncbi:MAG: PASTA domain-containing protein, partial [Actinobacteria bacterium]|nr:PASTA domain-containing protein [Actinomycetota bacterium]MCG2819532.1 PASTA domain-containing protein [Actinomycetes bacterium]MBU4217429.1 PASTA domain-containing protein [Actinomycetota bacterium]MBU4358812.1 PASTA domain-containing protein [Actinomycetota bacterium]MBU4392512.1 PASTA domain-containing protein [Actinomycetota bacterium]
DRTNTRATVRGETRRQKRRRNTITVILVCALVAGIIGGLVFAMTRSGGGPTVPELVGLSYEEAEKELEKAGLSIEPDPDQDTGGMEAGELGKKTVDDQDPKEGTEVEKDTFVTVTLKGVSSNEEEPVAGEDEDEPVVSEPVTPELVPLLDGAPLYPFTKDASIACGHWPAGSQDYPYFGAARDNNARIHAGIDVYPQAGEGAPTKAMKDGTVLKVALFYTRYTGEATYGVLVDHVDFVANYAELKPPSIKAGDTVKQGDLLGYISGTEQIHFEMYTPGTTDWISGWYGEKPANLLDATEMMLRVYGL